MSAGQTIGRFPPRSDGNSSAPRISGYRAEDTRRPVGSPFRFAVICDESFEGSYYGWPVDHYRTRCVAESAARSLNAGMARVDSHAIVGCKVVAS